MAKKNGKPQTAREHARSWAQSLLIAFVIWFFLRALLIEAFHITSGSMERTLLVGDWLFVNKAVYGAELPFVGVRLPALRDPRRGDIVVFDSVEEENLTVVKRTIGMPGDTIEMRDNAIYVDGDPLDEPYVTTVGEEFSPPDAKMRAWQSRYLVRGYDVDEYEPSLRDWGPIVVPPDSFLMLGDNRDFSYDGRYWGFLGRDRIRGRVMIVYYSFDKNGLMPLPFITAIRWGRLFRRVR